VLIQRDVKGLYKKALSGEIGQFTGISDLYEPPLAPELIIDSSSDLPEPSVEMILRRLEELGIVPAAVVALAPVPTHGELHLSSWDAVPELSFDI
jgi:hypothetical protein